MAVASSNIDANVIFFGIPSKTNVLLKSALEEAGVHVTLLSFNGQTREWFEASHPDLIMYDPDFDLARKESWKVQMQKMANQLSVPFISIEVCAGKDNSVEQSLLPAPGHFNAALDNIKFRLLRERELKHLATFQYRMAQTGDQLKSHSELPEDAMLFFDQLFLNSSISTIIFDPEGWALRVNDRFAELFGIEKEHIQGRKYNLFKDLALVKNGYLEGLERVFKHKEKGEWDILFDIGLSADSQQLIVRQRVIKTFRTWAFPITDVHGKLLHVVFQHLDLSELKQKDSRILLHEQILENLAEGVSLVRSADNCIVFTNPTFDRIFGYEPGELLNKHVSCLNGSDQESALQMVETIVGSLRKYGYWNGELLNVRKDGSPFWSMANVTSFDHPEHGLVWVTVQQDITNRIEAENALRKAEFENRTVLNTFPYIMFRMDANGKIFDYRAHDSSLLYTGPETFLGKRFVDVLPRELAQRLQLKITEALRTLKIVNIEYTLEIQGTDKYFEGRVIPISSEEVLLFAHDVSSFKRAEEAIRVSEERYNLVIQATKEGVWDWDMIKDIAFVSPRWREIMGVSGERNLLPHPFADWIRRIHPDHREWVKETFSGNMTKQGFIDIDYLYELKDQTYVWRRALGQVVLSKDGKPARMVGLSIDIDERKRFELQLEQSIKEVSDYKKALDQAAIVSVSDSIGTITYVNQKFCEQYGYTPEEVIGKNHKILNSGVHSKEFWQNFWSEISKGKVLKAEVCNKGKMGELHWSDTTIVPFLDASGTPYQFLAIRNDITQKRKLERELVEQKLKEQKLITEITIQEQEKERNELGRELHDNINQILATAKIYLGMARTHQGDISSFLDNSFTHLNSAIDEIRRLSHNLVAPTLGDIGLHEAVKSLLEGAGKTDSFKVKFQDHINDFSLLSKKGEVMLYRIIQEQLNNIRKHAAAKNVEIKFDRDGDDILLSIIDDGVGFNKSAHYSGIGLANIQNRVTFYDGRMQIVTAPGEGCTLLIWIPIPSTS